MQYIWPQPAWAHVLLVVLDATTDPEEVGTKTGYLSVAEPFRQLTTSKNLYILWDTTYFIDVMAIQDILLQRINAFATNGVYRQKTNERG